MSEREIIIHRIACNRPQEGMLWSNGDELWARLVAGDAVVVYPAAGLSLIEGVKAGTLIDCATFRLRFTGTVSFDLYDCDGPSNSTTPVEQRANEHLGELRWGPYDEDVQHDWRDLTPGAAAGKSSYKVLYSLRTPGVGQ
ncbi:MAG: hypothetical protein AUK47_15310 [Deltaproteobacteria bacterium CG2_30_63_29]|nr:MAG: hypothetical protein AUK47_15310 [Deltaproteobacteria bacterium CG2_30_63_29]PIW01535.1 MAG: hypothetical protein COW42_04625 [Deltaproteobacteria bacterium CG17_big_fil_post_rev_8_21_14_2_50_63_7]PJB40824.1 MAG: hypothetical protein CO108_14205 [Deltaproteobacteria bacterium CG_4_9_14_3_um_filter_63_12]